MMQEAGWIQDVLEDDELDAEKKDYELSRSLNKIRTQGDAAKRLPTSS